MMLYKTSERTWYKVMVSETQRKKQYINEVDKDSWFSDAKSDSNESSIRGNKSASQSQTEWFKTSCTRIEKAVRIGCPDREKLMAEWSHSSSLEGSHSANQGWREEMLAKVLRREWLWSI